MLKMFLGERRGGDVKIAVSCSWTNNKQAFLLSETNRCGTVIVFCLQSRKIDVDIVRQHISMGLLFGSETIIFDMLSQRRTTGHCEYLQIPLTAPICHTRERLLGQSVSEDGKIKVLVTQVVQDAVHIMTDENAMIELDYLIGSVKFFKMLSIGKGWLPFSEWFSV